MKTALYRNIFIIFLVLCRHEIFAQFEFKGNSVNGPILLEHLKDTNLGIPNFDSIQFEMRCWVNGYPGLFLQLSRDIENNWNYRIGYVSREFELNIGQEEGFYKGGDVSFPDFRSIQN